MSAIRVMLPEDAARIAEIHVRSWQSAYRGVVPDTHLDAMDVGQRTLVWQDILKKDNSVRLVIQDPAGGAIRGWAAWGACRDKDRDPAKTAELWAIYLCPSAYGQGYGWQLWQEIERQVRKEQLSEMTVWVLEGNLRARRFYERAGFTEEPGSRNAMERLGGIFEVRYQKRM